MFLGQKHTKKWDDKDRDLSEYRLSEFSRKLKDLEELRFYYNKNINKPAATFVISGDLFKIYFDQTIDLNLIKENLVKRQNKCQEELNKVSQRLDNKSFVDRAPKNIVDQEKTNYSDLKNDIQKIALITESL